MLFGIARPRDPALGPPTGSDLIEESLLAYPDVYFEAGDHETWFGCRPDFVRLSALPARRHRTAM